MQKINLKKVYTRDTTLIIQQGCIHAYTKGIFNECPYQPFMLFFMNNGVIEIWEHSKSTQWTKDRLQKDCVENKEKVLQILRDYELKVQELEKVWNKGFEKDKNEFIHYLDLVMESMEGYFYMYYLSMDERTPRTILDITFNLRATDKFFDANDLFIRESIKYLYPKSIGMETVFLIEEIKGKVSTNSILKKRFKNSFLLPSGICEISSLRDFLKSHTDYNFVDDVCVLSVNTTEIKGTIAYKGKVTGVVKVLRNKDDSKKVKEGEIIVSPMTTPAIMDAIKKASAIITDEGGITCHASIIAREMEKPCIIGTKIATKVLKDGMKVEVDADEGVVRIIE